MRHLLPALVLLCSVPLAGAQSGSFNTLSVSGKSSLYGGTIVGDGANSWILGNDYGLAVSRRALAVIGPANKPGVISVFPGNSATWWNLANVEGRLVVNSGALGGKDNTEPQFTNGAAVFTSFYDNSSQRVEAALGLGVGYTFNPQGYHLSIAGKARAEEIVVEVGWWSDFVFEDDYALRPLSEVATFIEQNGHLPDIPSAAEVAESGVALGDMQARLLQKVEELTLYVLEQDERLAALELENAQLRASVVR